jgi:hypothetical protein
MRLWACLLLAGGFVVGTACAERRQSDSDSAAIERSGARTSEAAFRARLGVTWELARLGNQDIAAAPARAEAPTPGRHPGPGSRPTIRFTDERVGALSDRPGTRNAGGWSFCNGYGTAYELGPGDQLRFHGFESTLVGCDGPDSLETRFFRGLGSTQRYELDSASLSLVAADGSRLRFVPSRGAAGSPPK